jgi:hypothetical protein
LPGSEDALYEGLFKVLDRAEAFLPSPDPISPRFYGQRKSSGKLEEYLKEQELARAEDLSEDELVPRAPAPSPEPESPRPVS